MTDPVIQAVAEELAFILHSDSFSVLPKPKQEDCVTVATRLIQVAGFAAAAHT